MALPIEAGYRVSEDPIYSDRQFSRFATDLPDTYIEVFEPPEPNDGSFVNYIEAYNGIREKLLDQNYETYIPEIVDSDEEDHWVAFTVVEGGYTLDELVKSHPNGIGGRDWAWIINRILTVLIYTERQPDLRLENFLVHPIGHGVILLGWQPEEDPASFPLDNLAKLIALYSDGSKESDEIQTFVRQSGRDYKKNRVGHLDLKVDSAGSELLGYQRILEEFRLKLQRIYGVRKFHELTVSELSAPYLSKESEALQKA